MALKKRFPSLSLYSGRERRPLNLKKKKITPCWSSVLNPQQPQPMKTAASLINKISASQHTRLMSGSHVQPEDFEEPGRARLYKNPADAPLLPHWGGFPTGQHSLCHVQQIHPRLKPQYNTQLHTNGYRITYATYTLQLNLVVTLPFRVILSCTHTVQSFIGKTTAFNHGNTKIQCTVYRTQLGSLS